MRAAPTAEEAEDFIEKATFHWYQRFELAGGVVTPGVRDIAWVLDRAGIPPDLEGARVLDIGTTNGGVAFEAERRKAGRVVAVDIVGPDVYGFSAIADFLGSSVEFLRSSVYSLELDDQFDLVFFLGVLYHLRHPLLALDSLHAVMRPGARFILESEIADHDPHVGSQRALVQFFRGAELADDPTNWFAPSSRALLDWCASSGFDCQLAAAWPEESPRRALVTGIRTEGDPEYVQISYERPLRRAVEPEPGPNGPLPLPPLEMRELVGRPEKEAFENATGGPAIADVDPCHLRRVFDFGCGCGRTARKLLQQHERPERYVGIDLHRGMIEWCRRNLQPRDPGFEFFHHDVYNRSFNPDGVRPPQVPFPVGDERFTLVNAQSVFTHILEDDLAYYLRECSRILESDGILRSTWFLFDKRQFPMMQEFQNTLYFNLIDPTNAVIVDKAWLKKIVADAGLAIVRAIPPRIRGFQWILLMQHRCPGREDVDLPEDTAPEGTARPPIGPADAATVGL